MKSNLNNISHFISRKEVQFLFRFILGGLFIYASIHKLADPAAFAKIIYNYKLFPDLLIYPMAIIVPWLELVGGLCLVAGIYSRAAATIISIMLGAFIIALTINLVRGLDFNCGCFSGADDGETGPLGLVSRDILLLIPGISIIFFHREKKKIER